MTLPNKLTLLRMFLVPVFMFFYMSVFIPYSKIIALVVFVLAAITDFIDGKIARSRNLVTDFGKLFDPIADKLLVLAGLVLVCVDGTVPAIMGAIILVLIFGRDFIITGLRAVAANQNKVIAADKLGKYKAFIIDIAVVMLIFAAFNNQYSLFDGFIYNIVSWSVLGLGTLLSTISCVTYLVKNREEFKDC